MAYIPRQHSNSTHLIPLSFLKHCCLFTLLHNLFYITLMLLMKLTYHQQILPWCGAYSVISSQGQTLMFLPLVKLHCLPFHQPAHMVFTPSQTTSSQPAHTNFTPSQAMPVKTVVLKTRLRWRILCISQRIYQSRGKTVSLLRPGLTRILHSVHYMIYYSAIGKQCCCRLPICQSVWYHLHRHELHNDLTQFLSGMFGC